MPDAHIWEPVTLPLRQGSVGEGDYVVFRHKDEPTWHMGGTVRWQRPDASITVEPDEMLGALYYFDADGWSRSGTWLLVGHERRGRV